ncbi:MFS transporter [Terrarubrum flagellatum]|uniref:MFS transporter n=1 Tax=Terrirubrum flagellatum TaxID=2895980 RepID=UPI003145013E
MSKSAIVVAGEAAVEAAPENPSPGWALASLCLPILLSSLGASIANVALPTLAQSFAASFQQVQWVVLSYLLAITTLIVSVGKLGDIVGRRRLLLAGILLFTGASLACAVAPTLGLLIVARAAQGFGAAVMMALAMALVGEAVSKDRTGSAMGLLGTMSAIGTALGPSLGGVLIGWFGWPSIFLINAPLGAAAYLLARRLPRDRQEAKADHRSFDFLGTLLLALTLAAYALATTVGRGPFGALNLGLLLAAASGAVLFVLQQARASSPLIRLAAFRDAALSAGLATSAVVATVVSATLVVGPFYLSRALGLSDAQVGLVLSTGPIVSALSGVLAGRIVDRAGASLIAVAGLALMAVGSFGLAVTPSLFGVAGYVMAIAALAPGYQLFQAANNTTVMADVAPDQRGVISGLLNLSRNLGLITGASAMGAVFAWASAAADVAAARPEAAAAGMRTTFIVAGCLILAALAFSARGRVRKATSAEA